MARLDAQRKELAIQTWRAKAIANVLSPQQARLFVRTLQKSWDVDPIAWSQRESNDQFADARRLLHAAGILRSLEGERSMLTDCYRRAGELLEWLARSEEPVTIEVPVALLAAGAYQLAEMPAMATSLLRASRAHHGVAGIFSAFLSADFDAVLAQIVQFWQENTDLTGREGSSPLLREGQGDQPRPAQDGAPPDPDHEGTEKDHSQATGRYLIAELIRVFGLLAESLRRGNAQRLDLAIEKLADLVEFSARLTSDELWLLLRLVEQTALRYRQSSVHPIIAPLGGQNPAHHVRLWEFAREQFARGRGILWASQVQGIDRLAQHDSFALCTPTGSGKTLVANLALIKELLLKDHDPLVAPMALYLVPSRALAGEVETKLTKEIGADILVTGLYGGSDWGITDSWLTAHRPVVLIATVEKAEALIRYIGHVLLGRLRLLILDEAHQVVSDGADEVKMQLAAHTNRSIRVESLVSRLLAAKPQLARIALTAVAGGAAGPVAGWFEGRADAHPIGLNYRSSRQLVGALRVVPNRPAEARLDMVNGQLLFVRGRDEPAYLPLRHAAMPRAPALVRDSLPHYCQIFVLWTALHLLEGGRRVLISVTQSPERLMKRYAEAFALPGWEALPPYELPENPDDRRRYDAARRACVDYCGPDSYEVRLLDRGIATNHGQMPQRIRRHMTDLIERKICPITVATATLTEGVNLPFDIIFLTSLERRRFDDEEDEAVVEPMSVAEFRNLAGRAGRPGAAEAIEGMTLIALPEAPATTAQSKLRTQHRQKDRAVATYDNLLERLQADTMGAPGNADAPRVQSPLAILIQSIWAVAHQHLGLQHEGDLHRWLEAALPEDLGQNIGTGSRLPGDMLADSLDELDHMLLAATEEVEQAEGEAINAAHLEALLARLWRNTFASIANAQEDWLERAFVKRGASLVQNIYPDPALRRKLYHYGFTPFIGRRFDGVSMRILEQLRGAAAYGGWDRAQRFDFLVALGETVRDEPGVGFRFRDTQTDAAIRANWHGILGWWLQMPGNEGPPADSLRDWQRFIADNVDFRLGVAVGAAVGRAWSENAMDQGVPTLDTWRETSGLPWVAFWIRELLRWGTLDPFVAFCLSQGMSQTREDAEARRGEFDGWLQAQGLAVDADARIDPRRFLAWQQSFDQPHGFGVEVPNAPVILTTVNAQRARYDVRPIVQGQQVHWVDAAGYSVAYSHFAGNLVTSHPERHDFQVETGPQPRVIRVLR